jgi:predicted  nucleic acid-binding Zn-ribbon protein
MAQLSFNPEVSVGDVFNCGIALISFATALFAIFSFRADHDRRRKQATIEQMLDVRNEYRDKWDKFRENGEKAISKKEAREIDETPERRKQVEDILSLFEHLSTGVNTGVFDLSLLNRLSGQYIINVFERCQGFIEYVREKDKEEGKTTRYYEEFYHLVNELKTLRGQPPVVLP